MAVLALAAAGAALAPAGYAAVGWTIGAAVGNALFAEDINISNEGPRLQDLGVQSSTDGAPILQVYGAMRVAGNIIWSSRIVETKHTETQEVGKGGGGTTVSNTTYTYKVSFVVGMCEGEIVGVSKIWADGRLIWENNTGSDIVALTEITDDIKIYYGDESQSVSSLMEQYEGTGEVPGHRGLAMIEFEDFDLTNYGNRIPNITAEVVQSGTFETPIYEIATRSLSGDVVAYDEGVIWTHDISVAEDGDDVVVTLIKRAYKTDGTLVSSNTYKPRFEGTRGSPYFKVRSVWGLPGGLMSGTFDGTHYLWLSIDGSVGPELQSFRMGEIPRYINDGGTGYILTQAYYSNTLRQISFIVSGTTLTEIATKVWDNVAFSVDQKTGKIYKQDRNTNDITEIDKEFNTLESWTYSSGGAQNHIAIYDSNLAFIDGTTLKVISLPSGGGAATLVDSLAGTGSSDVYVTDFANGILYWDGGIYLYSGRLIQKSDETLSDIVTDICQQAGLTAGDIDVSELTDNVSGYTLTRRMTAKAALQQLMQAYLFDAVESDGQIKFVKRGGDSSATISSSDLIGNDQLTIIKGQETELPREVELLYIDEAADYQQGLQRAQRIVTDSVRKETISMSLALTANEARQICEILQEDAWRSKYRYSFTLPNKYLYLEPTDVVTITHNGATHTIRITKIDYDGRRITMEGVSDDTAVYTSGATGATIEVDASTISKQVPGPTEAVLLDTPILRTRDNTPGFYVAAAGYLDDWSGASLYQSTDDGETWNVLDTVTTECTLGITTDALSTGISTIFDSSDTLNISLISGSLSSVTEAQVLNGANAAAYGSDGRWEIIQFQTATLEGDGTYTISKFLRGRKGTEYAMSQHSIGDKFIVLDTSSIRHIMQDSSTIGTEYKYKAVSLGRLLQNVSSETFSHDEAMRPIYVSHLKQRKQSNGDIDITWIPNARIDAEWRDYVETTTDTNTDYWTIKIYDETSSPATLVRTDTSTTADYTYTSADQTTDFGAGQTAVMVRVYEYNSIVGHSYGVEMDTNGDYRYVDPI